MLECGTVSKLTSAASGGLEKHTSNDIGQSCLLCLSDVMSESRGICVDSVGENSRDEDQN